MIDLDQNATTPLDPDVLEAMRPHWLAGGNAESRHSAGRHARRALDTARETVARILGAHPDEVVFTSGGTEASNLAVFGLARPWRGGTGHVVASSNDRSNSFRKQGMEKPSSPARTGRRDVRPVGSGPRTTALSVVSHEGPPQEGGARVSPCRTARTSC